jgi:hypothetical protein
MNTSGWYAAQKVISAQPQASPQSTCGCRVSCIRSFLGTRSKEHGVAGAEILPISPAIDLWLQYAFAILTQPGARQGGTIMRLLAIITVAICGLVATATTAIAADKTCNSTVTGPTTINDNVVVPNAATCTLTDVTVTGNVFVDRGANLTVNGGTIAGNVVGNQCHILNLYGPDLVIEGNVLILNCTDASGISAQSGPTEVDGNFLCINNDGSCTVYFTTISGNVLIAGNTTPSGFPFDSNISGNNISGNLICEGNTPPPQHYQGENTVAGHKIGQCSESLGF